VLATQPDSGQPEIVTQGVVRGSTSSSCAVPLTRSLIRKAITTATPHRRPHARGSGAGGAARPAAPARHRHATGTPAVVNAVCGAPGIDHIDTPLTPGAVWRAPASPG
jgi:hypothetical protein